MNSIIEAFFNESEFKMLQSGDVQVYQQEYIKGSSYWVVVKVDSLDDVVNSQNEIYMQISSDRAGDFDKNLSMLVVYNDDINQPNLERKLIRIEEDKYVFKKYVLHYHVDEVEDLKNYFKDLSGGSLASECLELAATPSIFDEYKTNSTKRNGLSLLYRLLAKMPFLKIDISQTEEFESIFALNAKNLDHASLSREDDLFFSALGRIELSELDENAILSTFDSLIEE